MPEAAGDIAYREVEDLERQNEFRKMTDQVNEIKASIGEERPAFKFVRYKWDERLRLLSEQPLDERVQGLKESAKKLEEALEQNEKARSKGDSVATRMGV